jgi:hypothetical protein
MAKYTVHAQITIYKELTVEASCRDEAILKYSEALDAEYGWADFDTVSVVKEED